ncbi:MAG: hypothetical protein ACPGJF_00105 [Sinimarinibacterium flocculans]|uniref:hypothetical protein n=1 Tax=Sinimarinibacterium flocculans TaxID=985250 RepID=UPI003C3BFEB0
MAMIVKRRVPKPEVASKPAINQRCPFCKTGMSPSLLKRHIAAFHPEGAELASVEGSPNRSTSARPLHKAVVTFKKKLPKELRSAIKKKLRKAKVEQRREKDSQKSSTKSIRYEKSRGSKRRVVFDSTNTLLSQQISRGEGFASGVSSAKTPGSNITYATKRVRRP